MSASSTQPVGGESMPAARGRDSGPWTVLAGFMRLRGAKTALVVLVLFGAAAILAPVIAPYGPFDRSYGPDGQLERVSAPSWTHLFGTTTYGYDVFSQVIWAARRTLAVGLIASVVTVVIGVNLGLISGYLGGRTDRILMRLTDGAYALPFLPLAIVLVGVLGRSDAVLLLAISLLFWRTTARVVRSQVLSLKERTFVRAAVVGGANRRRVLYVHIAPNIIPLAMLYGILLVTEAVLAEASLSFLGLAPPNTISWGTIMFDAFNSSEIQRAWWWPFFPGLAIMAFVLCLSLLGRAYEASQRDRLARA